jgi:hypothetical protein
MARKLSQCDKPECKGELRILPQSDGAACLKCGASYSLTWLLFEGSTEEPVEVKPAGKASGK